VTPVIVTPADGSAYAATGRLQLSHGGDYHLIAVYGVPDDPASDVRRACPSQVSIDPGGKYLYVASGYAAHNTADMVLNNDWVLVFDAERGGAAVDAVDVSGYLHGPAVMALSSSAATGGSFLYLAATLNERMDGTTRLWRFARSGSGLSFAGALDIRNSVSGDDFGQGLGFAGAVTAMAEDPDGGTLYVAGFTAPRFGADYPLNRPPFGDDWTRLYTVPTLAEVPAGTNWSMSSNVDEVQGRDAPIACHGLALPLAMVFVPGGEPDLDRDGDVDSDDLERFEACATGPEVPISNPACLPPGYRADLDGDGDVDQDDYGRFQRCFSGQGKLADAGCAG